MCLSLNYRLPMTEAEFHLRSKSDIRGLGYNKNSQAFVFSKKQTDRLEFFASLFPQYMERLEEIPCGQCSECRISYSREWAQRLLAESQTSKHSYFITLTYDDEHLPQPELTIERCHGNKGFYSSLAPEDMTLFIKRLRKFFSDKFGFDGIKYYYVGEYGPKTSRPHYHMILFTYDLDLSPFLRVVDARALTGRDYKYQVCELLEDKWQNGYVCVGEVNWDSLCYVARYCMKKLHGLHEEEYQKLCLSQGLTPTVREFPRMSRRPGIGASFYEQNKDSIYTFDKVVLPGGRVVKPSHYFDKLFDLETPGMLESLKKARKVLRDKKERDIRLTSKLSVEERENTHKLIVESRLKKLKRNDL